MNEHIKMNAPISHVLLGLQPEAAAPERSSGGSGRVTVRRSQASPTVIWAAAPSSLSPLARSLSGPLDISC